LKNHKGKLDVETEEGQGTNFYNYPSDIPKVPNDMNKKIHVLYIDDEDNNLKSFRATLRKDFKIFTAINAEDGLRIAQQEEIHVCIADQRMPGMTGPSSLSKWLRLIPDPIRILLTGYSDIASVIDAINKGGSLSVYR